MMPRMDPDKHLCVLYRIGELGNGPLFYHSMTREEQARVNGRLAERAPEGIWVDHDFFEQLRRNRHADQD